jgi:D-alanine transaminase
MYMELAMVGDSIVPFDEACISIHDRAVSFGDGVYEVLACRGGRLFEMERHMARLRHSLGEMEMLDRVDLDVIEERIHRGLRCSELSDAVVYLQVSRGAPYRTHDYPADWTPTFFLTVRPINPEAKLEATAITYPDIRWKRCDIKTLNLLGNVMAKHAAAQAGADEAILINDQGLVTEGSSTSILLVKDGRLRTAPLTANILPGVTRSLLLEWAMQDGISADETSFTSREAFEADELMMTGTITGVKAIVRIDSRTIGTGKIGPITRKMRERLDYAMSSETGLRVGGMA